MIKLDFKKWLEMAGGDAIVGSCKGGADFQIFGACSDLKNNHRTKKNSRKKKKHTI